MKKEKHFHDVVSEESSRDGLPCLELFARTLCEWNGRDRHCFLQCDQKELKQFFIHFFFSCTTGPEPSVHEPTLPCSCSSPHQGAGTWAERCRPIRMTSPLWARDALSPGAAGRRRCGCALLIRRTSIYKENKVRDVFHSTWLQQIHSPPASVVKAKDCGVFVTGRGGLTLSLAA